jgi:hypothetical protein
MHFGRDEREIFQGATLLSTWRNTSENHHGGEGHTPGQDTALLSYNTRSPLMFILSQMNQIHILPSNFFKLHFNIIFITMADLLNGIFSDFRPNIRKISNFSLPVTDLVDLIRNMLCIFHWTNGITNMLDFYEDSDNY